MDFSIISFDTSSWYFLLATILPLIASLLVFAWGCRNYYFYGKTKKNNIRDNSDVLKGSFGYRIKRSELQFVNKKDELPVDEKNENLNNISENTVSEMSSKKEDKRPLIYDSDDDALRLSDIDVLQSDDSMEKSTHAPSFPIAEPKQRKEDEEDEEEEDEDEDDDDDMNFDYSHAPGKLKSSKFIKATKQLEKSLTDEQKAEEAEIRNKQLEAIFKLMKEQEEKFGTQSNEELQEQMKLYAL